MNKNGSNPDVSGFAHSVDVLVSRDVYAKGQSVQSQPLERAYSVVPGSSFPARGYQHAEKATRSALEMCVLEQEVLRNLARVLKVAVLPELAFYVGKPAARIDRIAVDEPMLQRREWQGITEVAVKALHPVSVDEHVIQELSRGVVSSEHGVALLKFGDSRFGNSDNPVFAIVRRYAYCSELEVFDAQGDAETAYRALTGPGEDKTVSHVLSGNFLGGAVANNMYHPSLAVGSSDMGVRDAATGAWGVDGPGLPDDVMRTSFAPRSRSFLWVALRSG